MLPVLFLVFVVMPIIELAVIIKVGAALGVAGTALTGGAIPAATITTAPQKSHTPLSFMRPSVATCLTVRHALGTFSPRPSGGLKSRTCDLPGSAQGGSMCGRRGPDGSRAHSGNLLGREGAAVCAQT